MANQGSNRAKLELLKGAIDFTTDIFKIILMGNAYAFNPASAGGYADLSASELITGFGYTAGGLTLAGVTVTQDNALGLGKVVANNVAWTAAGGPIGPASGAIIYDDTHGSKVVIGYIDFGGGKTAIAAGTFTIANIVIQVV